MIQLQDTNQNKQLFFFIFNFFILMPSNDFHLMIESLHILLSEILAAGFEKSYFEAIWFINSPTGFPPATRSQLVSIPSKK
jgi:hypothetical protein